MDYADNDKEEIDSELQLILGENKDLETGNVTKRPKNLLKQQTTHLVIGNKPFIFLATFVCQTWLNLL